MSLLSRLAPGALVGAALLASSFLGSSVSVSVRDRLEGVRDTPVDIVVTSQDPVTVLGGHRYLAPDAWMTQGSVTPDQVRALRGVEGTRAVGAGVLDLLGPREVFDAECARVVFQVNEILSRGRPRVLVLALETVLTGVRASIEDMERASGQSGKQASTLLTIRFGILARLVADMIGPE